MSLAGTAYQFSSENLTANVEGNSHSVNSSTDFLNRGYNLSGTGKDGSDDSLLAFSALRPPGTLMNAGTLLC